MDHRMSGRPSERARADPAALSDREREVLELALTGLSARAIAERLTLTEATIRSHLARIYAKHGVSGRVELLASLRGQSPDAGGASPTPSADTARPRRRPRRAWAVAGLAVLALALGAVAFLWLRPDLPPATNFATVSQWVAQGQATSLDLRGDTLFVTTSVGRNYRVDGVDLAVFREIVPQAIAAGAEVRISGGSSASPAVSIMVFVSEISPLIILLLVAAVAYRWLHRPPRLRPAA